MSTASQTIAEIAAQLGVSPDRILDYPAPGMATVEDVLAINDRDGRLFELINGVLVEKAMGFQESRLAAVLIYILETHLEDHDIGIVLGADGMLRLNPAQVRIPDVSFISWDQLPAREYPEARVPSLYPDLAVEVLSDSNTPREMEQKLRDYFAAGTRQVWYLDPTVRSARVYTSPDDMIQLDETQTLEGGEVMPGFQLVIADWFLRARRPGQRA